MRIINYRIVAFASIFILIGAFVGRLLTSFDTIFLILIPLVLTASGILYAIVSKKFSVMVLLLAMAIGMSASAIDANLDKPSEVEGTCVISGRICEQHSVQVFTLDNLIINGEKVNGKAKIGLFNEEESKIGQIVYAAADVQKYEVQLFDFESASAYCDRIYYQFNVKSDVLYVQGTIHFNEKIKLKIYESLEKYLSEENVGMLKSLLFGDKSSLFHADKLAINGIGLAHVFAVSGLHVGFVAAVITYILRKLKMRGVPTLIITLSVLILYGSVTGLSSGVKRATIGYTIFYLGKLLARKSDPLTTASLSAALIVLFNPRELFDLSFVMSFAAVLGLICFYSPAVRIIMKKVKNKVMVYILKIGLATVAANAFILPIMCNVFGTFSVYAIPANILILPIISVLFPVAAIICFFSVLWQGFGCLLIPLDYVLDIIRRLSYAINELPGSLLSVGEWGYASICYVLMLIVMSRFILLSKKAKLIPIGALGAGMMILSLLL